MVTYPVYCINNNSNKLAWLCSQTTNFCSSFVVIVIVSRGLFVMVTATTLYTSSEISTALHSGLPHDDQSICLVYNQSEDILPNTVPDKISGIVVYIV